MTTRLKYSFVRTGEFTMIGGVSIDVEDPEDAEEIAEKLDNKQFAEYLPIQNIQTNDDWDFDPLPEGDEDSAD